LLILADEGVRPTHCSRATIVGGGEGGILRIQDADEAGSHKLASMDLLKLLVVEDDPASLELMIEVFASLKTNVCPVSDSQKAAALLNQERFDGIFLDIEMPNLNGFELAQVARQSSWNKSTPIVVVTGREQSDTMFQAFATGATFFLQKPIDRLKLAGLLQTVEKPLHESRRRYTRVPMQT
jgi:CheY-like chemotaxis protein